MNAERQGELLASVAYALVKDATPQERQEIVSDWQSFATHLPLAIAASEGAVAARDSLMGEMKSMIEDAVKSAADAIKAQQLASTRR